MTTLVAIVPILSLLFFMVVLEKPAYIAASVSLAITLSAVLFFWQMDANWVSASILKGVFLASEIMFILAGVFLLIAVLKKSRAFSFINHFVFGISRDIRVQAILLAWFSVSFVEGIAGFGTPSMIVAPIMVSLGFSPLAAVITTLVGDGMSVTFGAAGVPMTIGIAEGVNAGQAAALGANFVSEVSLATALIHSVLGIFLPLVILCLLSFIYSRSFKKAFEMWKFALVSGLAFSLPYLAVALYIGPEFPTIIGSVSGGVLIAIMARFRFFLPKKEWVFEETDKKIAEEFAVKHHRMFYVKAVAPYAIVFLLLILTRLDVFSVGKFFSEYAISAEGLYGTTLSHSFRFFYSPGFFFAIAAAAGYFIFKRHPKDAVVITKYVLGKVVKIFIALAAVLSIVQILIYSNNNAAGLPSLSNHLMAVLSNTGNFWPIFSPLVGFLGAFIAGSSTVSNLMFSSLQAETASVIGMSPILGLALQSIGSAVGNMVAVHNVVAASAVVHLKHAEGKVIKYNLLPALLYAFSAGLIGYIIFRLI